jgi:hypothetical protein
MKRKIVEIINEKREREGEGEGEIEMTVLY